ncbi:hypothetical protein PG984_016234 [Apiospora sp. TS-2023a]
MTSAELDGLVEDVYDVVDGIAEEGGPEVTSKRKREKENPTESFEVAQAEVTRLIPEVRILIFPRTPSSASSATTGSSVFERNISCPTRS